MLASLKWIVGMLAGCAVMLGLFMVLAGRPLDEFDTQTKTQGFALILGGLIAFGFVVA